MTLSGGGTFVLSRAHRLLTCSSRLGAPEVDRGLFFLLLPARGTGRTRALTRDRGTGLGERNEAQHHRAFAVAHLPHQPHAPQLAARALVPGDDGIAVA